MRKEVVFAMEHFDLSERRACKLVGLDRSSYRYEPTPDHNVELHQELVSLARQKPRYGYRRLHALCAGEARLRGQRTARVSAVSGRRPDGASPAKQAALASGRGFSPGAVQPGMGVGLCLRRAGHRARDPRAGSG
jgi:hypothetical protein